MRVNSIPEYPISSVSRANILGLFSVIAKNTLGNCLPEYKLPVAMLCSEKMQQFFS